MKNNKKNNDHHQNQLFISIEFWIEVFFFIFQILGIFKKTIKFRRRPCEKG